MLVTANDQELRRSEEFARKLFSDDPSISIDRAARMVNEHCTRGLVKGVLASIRMDVKQSLRRLTLVEDQVGMVKRKPQDASRGDRIEWLESWVLDHPFSKVKDAQQALHHHFGVSLSNDLICKTMNIARGIWEEAQRMRGQAPALPEEVTPEHPQAPDTEPLSGVTEPNQKSLALLASIVHKLSIRKLEVSDDGSWTVVMAGKL